MGDLPLERQPWNTSEMPASATATSTVTHNYDTGAIHIEGDLWRVIGPTGAPSVDPAVNPEALLGAGRRDRGLGEHRPAARPGTGFAPSPATARATTATSAALCNAADRFATFWADGNPDTLTESHLYFGNKDGTRCWELPYHMTTATASPVEVGPHSPGSVPAP